jgi:alpha-tubulin suppressor-like RCC1 family protein
MARQVLCMYTVCYRVLSCDHISCVQLGDGTNTNRNTPSADVLTSVAAIAAGNEHTCALTTSGGVRCWGGNNYGQASAAHAYSVTLLL